MKPEQIRQQVKFWRDHADRLEAKLPPEEPWTLSRELPGFRALRDGEEWHRLDGWTKEMLPAGWRPLLKNERVFDGDSFHFGRIWTAQIISNKEGMPYPQWMDAEGRKIRTTRNLPLLTPEQIAQGWIEWHGGENPVPGKRIEIMIRTGGTAKTRSDNLRWSNKSDNGDIIAYRVIEPKLVPLGPEDVPPGSVFRLIEHGHSPWVAPFAVTEYVVHFSTNEDIPSTSRTWEYLMEKAEINRSIPLTGKWDASAWEPCQKEAAE